MLVPNHANDRGYDLAAVDYCSGGTAVPHTYAPGTHRLASVGGTPRSYDANGNTQAGTAPNLTLGYDDRNRLATATAGVTTTTYGYNGRGERVSKQVGSGGFGQAPMQYVYDEAGHLLGDYQGATSQAEYVYLDDTPIAVVKGNAVSYIETDHLGTPRQVVNPTTNQPLWTWDFLGGAFGTDAPNASPGGGAAYTLNLRFPGQYYDAETSLNYNYFRDYDPTTGRYIESDPIGLVGGISTYAYVGDDPLDAIDPTGWYSTGGMYNGANNTIICDGSGSIIPALIPLDDGNRRCGVGECETAHEDSHIKDVRRANPSVCVGKPRGTTVVADGREESKRTESRAFAVEIACLRRKLSAASCDKYGNS